MKISEAYARYFYKEKRVRKNDRPILQFQTLGFHMKLPKQTPKNNFFYYKSNKNKWFVFFFACTTSIKYALHPFEKIDSTFVHCLKKEHYYV